jgi:hypothetical protein
MKFFYQTLTLLVLVLMAPMASAKGQDASIVVAKQGESELLAKFGSGSIRATIRAHQVEISQGEGQKLLAGNLACTQSRSPCSVVDQLSIAVNGKSLFVPVSLFSDVADVNKMEVAEHGGEFDLMIYGGDASEGYVLKIIFDGGRIKQRILISPLMPGEPLEETTYYRRILGD